MSDVVGGHFFNVCMENVIKMPCLSLIGIDDNLCLKTKKQMQFMNGIDNQYFNFEKEK